MTSPSWIITSWHDASHTNHNIQQNTTNFVLFWYNCEFPHPSLLAIFTPLPPYPLYWRNRYFKTCVFWISSVSYREIGWRHLKIKFGVFVPPLTIHGRKVFIRKITESNTPMNLQWKKIWSHNLILKKCSESIK